MEQPDSGAGFEHWIEYWINEDPDGSTSYHYVNKDGEYVLYREKYKTIQKLMMKDVADLMDVLKQDINKELPLKIKRMLEDKLSKLIKLQTNYESKDECVFKVLKENDYKVKIVCSKDCQNPLTNIKSKFKINQIFYPGNITYYMAN